MIVFDQEFELRTDRRAYVHQISSLAASLGLPGLEIFDAALEDDGSWTWHVASAGGEEACCPSCGGGSSRAKEPVMQSVKHLVVVPVTVAWHKPRLWCDEQSCERETFTPAGVLAVPGGRVGVHAKQTMGHLIGDWLVPASRVADGVGVAWHTAHDGFVAVAAQAGITVADTGTGPEPEVEADAGDGVPTRPVRSVSGLLPKVEALGIDDHRRGRPLFHRHPVTGRWVQDADRWQTVFVDSSTGHGLLGQAEGRAGADAVGWLNTCDRAWLAAVRWVTIDMSPVYKSVVVGSGLLPNAKLIVDMFHVAQLANKMVGDVRRRVTYQHYGRRGRAKDPEYAIKNVLVRGKENLSQKTLNRLLVTFKDLGGSGRQLGAAWRAKEHLRALLALSPNRTGRAPNRAQIDKRLEAFFTFCATVGETVPEIQTLAATVSLWRQEICRGVATGLSNAAAESVNRIIKLLYRSAFGFKNVSNQQRRSRYTASRSTRAAWLRPALADPDDRVTT